MQADVNTEFQSQKQEQGVDKGNSYPIASCQPPDERWTDAVLYGGMQHALEKSRRVVNEIPIEKRIGNDHSGKSPDIDPPCIIQRIPKAETIES